MKVTNEPAKAVVFDLDYTLWPCWCDTHLIPPLKPVSETAVCDASGFRLELFRDVPSILKDLRRQKIVVIGASRTARPDIARQLLQLYRIEGRPMIECFDSLQWGQGSKIKHIQNAVQELDISDVLNTGNIILFDDELRNQDVKRINCRFCHIYDDEKGLTLKLFSEAMETLP